VSRRGAGLYSAAFQVQRPGEYNLLVRYKPEREFKEVLAHKICFSEESHHGSLFNLPTGTQRPNQAVRFCIQSRDRNNIDVVVGGDPWQAVASGPDKVTHLILTDQRNGTYTGEITFPSQGIYNVMVTLNGDHAEKSPFKVTVA